MNCHVPNTRNLLLRDSIYTTSQFLLKKHLIAGSCTVSVTKIVGYIISVSWNSFSIYIKLDRKGVGVGPYIKCYRNNYPVVRILKLEIYNLRKSQIMGLRESAMLRRRERRKAPKKYILYLFDNKGNQGNFPNPIVIFVILLDRIEWSFCSFRK